jgi:dsDNA-specific endonuclease/ATPase MutS2
MTALEKIQDQLEKAMSELKELNQEETQLAYDYIEYANILVKNLILYSVSKPLNEDKPQKLQKGDKIRVIKNKTSHCYKIGDTLRIIKKDSRYDDAWYCKKGWFGIRQILHDDEFYVC